MSRSDHNLFGVADEKRDLDYALREYRERWGTFLRSHGITLPQIRSLDSGVLIALTFLKLNDALCETLHAHELRLRALERDRAARSEAPFDLGKSTIPNDTPANSTGD